MKLKIDKRFYKEAVVLSIANLVNSLANGVTIIYLNKFLANSESGVFLFLLSVASPIFIFFSFDLRRKFTANQLDGLSVKQVNKIRNIFAIVAFIMFSIISLISSAITSVLILAIVFIGIGKVFDSLSELNFAIFQKKNKEFYILISRFIKLFLIVGLVYFNNNITYEYLFFIFLLANFLPYIVFELPLLNKIYSDSQSSKSIFDLNIIYKFIKKNIGLAFASLVMTLSPNIPTYFVKMFHDINMVTYFSSINFIVSSIYITGSGVGYALLKKFSRKTEQDLSNNIKILTKAIIFSFISYLIFGVIFYMVNGLSMAFNDNYSNLYVLFSLLLASGFLFTVSSYLNNYILFSYSSSSSIFRIRFIRLVVTTMSCIIIPYIFNTLDAFGYALVFTNIFDVFVHLYIIKIKGLPSLIDYDKTETVLSV